MQNLLGGLLCLKIAVMHPLFDSELYCVLKNRKSYNLIFNNKCFKWQTLAMSLFSCIFFFTLKIHCFYDY